MMILAVLVGLALLFFGRQLFWLFVGGIGFAAGILFATSLVQGQPGWVVLAIAVLAGIIGALLSIFLQRFAIGLAGFAAGGYALWNLASASGRQDLAWIGFIVGGIVGALLVMILFDWALVFLSALTGSILVSGSLPLQPAVTLLVWIALFIAGLITQATQLRKPVPAQPARSQPDRT